MPACRCDIKENYSHWSPLALQKGVKGKGVAYQAGNGERSHSRLKLLRRGSKAKYIEVRCWDWGSMKSGLTPPRRSAPRRRLNMRRKFAKNVGYTKPRTRCVETGKRLVGDRPRDQTCMKKGTALIIKKWCSTFVGGCARGAPAREAVRGEANCLAMGRIVKIDKKVSRGNVV